MDPSASSSRLVPALAVTAVSIAAVATVIGTWLSQARQEEPPARPSATALVDVVKAPPTSTPTPVADRQPAPCATCAMGASGRSL